MARPERPEIPLPGSWPRQVKSAVLHVISSVYFSITCARGRAVRGRDAQSRLTGEVERLLSEIALLREELRIKDARMRRVAAQRRPHYSPLERMEILELRAARGWSLAQTARAFLVTPATIGTWMKRVDEQGQDALLALPEPVNKFPDFVRYIVARLKASCPQLGKVKIAQVLCRAGWHLAATTVGRILKQSPPREPKVAKTKKTTPRVITAKFPNHVWHVDLTVVPTGGGFWTAWWPFALPQYWPFCWWVAVVVDQHSRRAMGYAVFKKQPTSEDVRAFLGRTIGKAKATPKHLICDKGVQFWCHGFKRWCRCDETTFAGRSDCFSVGTTNIGRT